MANFVQFYKSTDKNAPALTGVVGSLIGLLNQCLVDGYGTGTPTAITSITKSGTTATVTLAAANPNLKVGDLVTVAGATGGDATYYNGSFPIATLTNSTTFTYTMTGTPSANASGTLTYHTLLPVSSVTRSSSTATVTLAYADTTLVTGQYVLVAGANEGDYNGIVKITVTDSTHFTYTVANAPTTPATGTITYRKAPLQWLRPFAAGTNSQSYRSADTDSNQLYVQIVDNGATAGGAREAQMWGSEKLTSDQVTDTANGYQQFPTTTVAPNGLCVYKSTSLDSTARAWALFGDGKTFYMVLNNGTYANPYGFGHFISFKSGDAYNTFVSAPTTFNNSSVAGQCFSSAYPFSTYYSSDWRATAAGSLYGARSYSQIGSHCSLNVAPSSPVDIHGNASVANYFGSSLNFDATQYPNATDSGLFVGPAIMWEPLASGYPLRGRLPGVFQPWHKIPLSNYDTATNIVGLSNVTLTAVTLGNTAGQVFVDTFGPWT